MKNDKGYTPKQGGACCKQNEFKKFVYCLHHKNLNLGTHFGVQYSETLLTLPKSK